MQGLAKQSIYTMYTEQHLVSFGNFLLDIYGVMVHSNDGSNKPLYKREVCDADLRNWKVDGAASDHVSLLSWFNIGDQVVFSVNQIYGQNPYPLMAEVIAIHFYEGKVKYDLSIPIETQSPTRIYNIDSCFVLPKPMVQ